MNVDCYWIFAACGTVQLFTLSALMAVAAQGAPNLGTQEPVGEGSERMKSSSFQKSFCALGAHRGFFVARQYTKDARTQAALDNRVKLIDVEEEQFTDLHAPLALAQLDGAAAGAAGRVK
jgi:hypothetical protein